MKHPAPSTPKQPESILGTAAYVRFLDELGTVLNSNSSVGAIAYLDGLASKRCSELLDKRTLRGLGAFFTPTTLAQKLAAQLKPSSWADTRTYDPACGAGDLLLQIARKLPRHGSASSTLQLWNRLLSGSDISPEFVQAARLRLVLLAKSLGCVLDASTQELASLMSNVSVGDGLGESTLYEMCTHIVMNPPYGRIIAQDKSWRVGTTTAAAVFVERALLACRPGTHISAILPEVLRTGTSYEAWRKHIAKLAKASTSKSLGLFSAYADVDVYLQHFLRLRSSPIIQSSCTRPAAETVGDHFEVAVGTVVPFRHVEKGPIHAFLHPKNAKPWSDLRRISETRHFEGKAFSPPFVVVRRTSRPGDEYRAVASLVLGNRKVAVENHLIVLTPKSGGVVKCRKLIARLGSRETSLALDATMRCRHLTTASLSELSWK